MKTLRNRIFSELSFTLLELLVVIAILGVLAAMISGNFVTSMIKGRDAKRKSDLEHLQKAIEMYYEDNRSYPPSVSFGSLFQNPSGTKTYMQLTPRDPNTTYTYDYDVEATGLWFKLYACIENANDRGEGVDPDGYSGTSCCGGGTPECKYRITSPNAPLP